MEWYNKAMKGISLTFNIEQVDSTDATGDPVMTVTQSTIDNCLIAPLSTPTNAREQLALEQGRLQVEIHLPKADNTKIGGSIVIWGGVAYKVDVDNTPYIEHLTPTDWNRRVRGEAIDI